MLDAQSRLATWQESSRHVFTGARQQTRNMVLYERVKRLLDIALALTLLIVLSPLMLLIAIAIKLDSPGPVMFVQRRTGRYGKPFNFFKFRSMSYGVDHGSVHREFARRYANGELDASERHEVHKPASNGRVITRVGKWLRRSSLDELPQLWNILKGDMSFVGPRAWADYELENYKDWHYRRLEVLPGLTGLAQISGRSSLSFDQIIRLDIEYIENRSLWLDLKIMLLTIPVVLTGRYAG